MGILTRCKDILAANINELLDRAEDPSKMIDQYLRNLMEDLAEVKKETAGVMAEEARTRRLVDDNKAEVAKYAGLAKKAIEAGSDDDARVFLTRKQELETTGASLESAYAAAHENAIKMRQMHDKLTADIQSLNTRKQAIKAKVAVAKTQQTLNQASSAAEKSQGAMDAFSRMEAKADRMLDEASAMADLNAPAPDSAMELESKYASNAASASVEDELARLKAEMGK